MKIIEATKGWKAFDKDLCCRGFQYEVGKTYKRYGDMELCSAGFHFHKDIRNIFDFYVYGSRVCEVSAVGGYSEGGKSVTNEITIGRELSGIEIDALTNKGRFNSEDRNSGDRNSGDLNSGDRNSGYRNSGDLNSGDMNSGDMNSGNRNSGYLCTETPKYIVFDLPTETDMHIYKWPLFFFFDLCVFVKVQEMDESEKDNNPSYKTEGGYLKTLDYKEAWRISWSKADIEDKRKVLDIPNWNNGKFMEITGIDVERELAV